MSLFNLFPTTTHFTHLPLLTHTHTHTRLAASTHTDTQDWQPLLTQTHKTGSIYSQIVCQVVLLQCVCFKAMRYSIKVVIPYSTDEAFGLQRKGRVVGLLLVHLFFQLTLQDEDLLKCANKT